MNWVYGLRNPWHPCHHLFIYFLIWGSEFPQVCTIWTIISHDSNALKVADITMLNYTRNWSTPFPNNLPNTYIPISRLHYRFQDIDLSWKTAKWVWTGSENMVVQSIITVNVWTLYLDTIHKHQSIAWKPTRCLSEAAGQTLHDSTYS